MVESLSPEPAFPSPHDFGLLAFDQQLAIFNRLDVELQQVLIGASVAPSLRDSMAQAVSQLSADQYTVARDRLAALHYVIFSDGRISVAPELAAFVNGPLNEEWKRQRGSSV